MQMRLGDLACTALQSTRFTFISRAAHHLTMKEKAMIVAMAAVVLSGMFSTTALGQTNPEQVVHGTYVIDIPAGAYSQDAKFFYRPSNVAIPSGTTVVWFNDDPNQIHTVTSGHAGDEDAGSKFDSGFMQQDAFYQQTFDTAGEFPFFCTVHPWMVGSVMVSDAVWQGHHFDMGMGTGPVFNFTENSRNLLSFKPTSVEINEDAPVNYQLTIVRGGQQVFSDDFLTLGGNLQVELIPTDNATNVYGPDVSDPVIGAYHIEGSFLKEPGEYKISAEITTIAGEAPDSQIGDEFSVQIVPEFPVGSMAAVLAGVGAVIALGRKRLGLPGST